MVTKNSYMQKYLSKIKHLLNNKYFRLSSYALLAIVLIVIVLYGSYVVSYNDKFYPNVKIGEINLGGKNLEQAKTLLEEKAVLARAQGLEAKGENLNWRVDAANLKVNYDIEKSLSVAYKIGRDKSIYQNFKTRVALVFSSRTLIATFSYNHAEIEKLTADINQKINVSGQDATLKIVDNEVQVITENVGKEVDNNLLDGRIISVIGYLDNNRTVEIPVKQYIPKVKSSDLDTVKNEIARVIKTPIKLKWENNVYQFSSQDIGSWIEFSTVNKDQATGSWKTVHAAEKVFSFSYLFNQKRIEASIAGLGKDINQDPVDAKLTIASGKATVFQSSEDGYELDQIKTATEIANILSARQKVAGVSSEENLSSVDELELSVKVKKPAISNETVNNLGIKELISTGSTSYKGSPENRKYNIALGASFFNGVLIKPGETFSFMGTLGNVTEARGFRQELVIKEDRTEPEVGGGLCQVSTTMFRAALNSGMEITERSNHKYRVSYYEPPVGMDATVYDPSPDLKFKNNTNGYILIQSKIIGTTLTFEFYGTKDSRKVEISDPTLYDITDPGEPIYVEDPSLAPGEVKQTEKAHQGAKASFYYKVTSQSGEVITEKTFNSVYSPWPAKYLKGPDLPPEENNPNQINS